MAFKFDRSEPGFWVSGATHATVLVVGLVAFSSPKFPEAEEGIPVEIVTDNQFSQITKGDLSAKEAKPDPKPRVERVDPAIQQRDPGEAQRDTPAPPKRPAEMKVEEEPVEAAAAAPPPPPPARPETKPEPAKAIPEPPRREEPIKLAEREDPDAIAKAEAAKAEAESKAKAAAIAKAKADFDSKKAMAEAVAKAEAEEQQKKAEAAERAKLIKEAKLRAEAKAKAEAEAKAKKQAELADKFNTGDIRQLLASRDAHQSTGSTGRELNRTASLGTATGSAQKLNPSQRDQLMGLLRDQLHRCWQAPFAAQSADKPPVPAVRVRLREDGSLAAEPAVLNTSADPLFRVIADSATRATRRCAPLKIPAQFAPYYQDWKDLVVNFDPRDMG